MWGLRHLPGFQAELLTQRIRHDNERAALEDIYQRQHTELQHSHVNAMVKKDKEIAALHLREKRLASALSSVRQAYSMLRETKAALVTEQECLALHLRSELREMEQRHQAARVAYQDTAHVSAVDAHQQAAAALAAARQSAAAAPADSCQQGAAALAASPQQGAAALAATRQQAAAALAAADTNAQQAQLKVSALEAEAQVMMANYTRLEQDHEVLQEHYNNAHRTIGDLQAERLQQQQLYDQLSQQALRLQQLTAAPAALGRHSSQVDNLMQHNTELHLVNSTLQQTAEGAIDGLQQQVASLQQGQALLQQEHLDAQDTITSMSEEAEAIHKVLHPVHKAEVRTFSLVAAHDKPTHHGLCSYFSHGLCSQRTNCQVTPHDLPLVHDHE